MKFHAYLIKYAEIGLKGKNRYLFEDALVHQIRQALKRTDGEFDVVRVSGRIYVNALSDFDEEETLDLLSRVFGIVGICPMIRIEDNGFDDLAEHLIEYVREVYPEKNFTFKVYTRRARKNYPMNSMEVSAELGSRLLDAFPDLKVDVHDPEVVLSVEIRERINIYSREIKGPGGMPVGSNGKAMLLLSGGIDSPVAGYDRQARRQDRRGVFPRAALYQRAGKAESGRSGGHRGALRRSDRSSHCEYYRAAAVSVRARASRSDDDPPAQNDDADCGRFCGEGRIAWTDHRREYRSGGFADNAVACRDE